MEYEKRPIEHEYLDAILASIMAYFIFGVESALLMLVVASIYNCLKDRFDKIPN